MGRLWSAMRVSASFQVIPRLVGRLGLGLGLGSGPRRGSVRVRNQSRETLRVKSVDRRMVVVEGGNVLHHVKREGNCPGGRNVRGQYD